MEFQTVIFCINLSWIVSIRILNGHNLNGHTNHLGTSIYNFSSTEIAMKFSDFFYSKQNRNIIFWLAWTLPLHWGILFLNSFAAFVFVLLATAFSIPDIIQEIVVTILSTVLFPFRWGLFSAVIGVPFTVGTMLLLYASFPLGLLTKIPKSKNSNQAQNGLDSNQYSYILRYISYLNLVVSVLLMGFDLANYP